MPLATSPKPESGRESAPTSRVPEAGIPYVYGNLRYHQMRNVAIDIRMEIRRKEVNKLQ